MTIYAGYVCALNLTEAVYLATRAASTKSAIWESFEIFEIILESSPRKADAHANCTSALSRSKQTCRYMCASTS